MAREQTGGAPHIELRTALRIKMERDELRGLIVEVMDHPCFNACDCGKTHCLTYRLRAALALTAGEK